MLPCIVLGRVGHKRLTRDFKGSRDAAAIFFSSAGWCRDLGTVVTQHVAADSLANLTVDSQLLPLPPDLLLHLLFVLGQVCM